MKKLLIILQLASFPFLVSCKKETPGIDAETAQQSQNITPADASKMLATCNKWVIASYMDNGNDQTADFNMTGLYFCPDSFTVSNDSMSQNGKWFFSQEAGNLKLNISFNTSAVLNPAWTTLQD